MALALTAFHVAILFIAAAVLVAAAVSDAHSYRIPNYMCALLVALFPVGVLTAPHPIHWQQNLAVFALVAVVGFAMFLGKMTSAGDIKLLSAASLWAGPHLIAFLLTVTAFVGGIEAILVTLIAVSLNKRRNQKTNKALLLKKPIPYGIAIAAGGLVILGMMAQPILLPG